MNHAILIPHRNRARFLRLCLVSIERSLAITRADNFTAYVIEPDAGHTEPRVSFEPWPWVKHIAVPGEMPIFNKSLLLNVGIERAVDYGAHTATILDADAHVGPRWLECLDHCSLYERLVYRVRYILESRMGELEGENWRDVFAKYDELQLGYEAYQWPLDGHFRPWLLPWGNSQMTVRTDVLRDLRFDEGYVGRGYEDLDFSRRLRIQQSRRGYDSAFIFTHASHALIHVRHGYAPDWRSPEIREANHARFRRSTRPPMARTA